VHAVDFLAHAHGIGDAQEIECLLVGDEENAFVVGHAFSSFHLPLRERSTREARRVRDLALSGDIEPSPHLSLRGEERAQFAAASILLIEHEINCFPDGA